MTYSERHKWHYHHVESDSVAEPGYTIFKVKWEHRSGVAGERFISTNNRQNMLELINGWNCAPDWKYWLV